MGVLFVTKNSLPLYVDICTKSLTKDSWNAIDCFNAALNTQKVKSLFEKSNIKYVQVWMDRGTHYCSFEMLYYWLFKFYEEYKISPVLNYFEHKHGKNDLDQHFSKVSLYLKQKEKVQNIWTSDDIVNTINDSQDAANKNYKPYYDGLEVYAFEYIPTRLSREQTIKLQLKPNILDTCYKFF